MMTYLDVINPLWDKMMREGRERKKGEREKRGMKTEKKERTNKRKEGNYPPISIIRLGKMFDYNFSTNLSERCFSSEKHHQACSTPTASLFHFPGHETLSHWRQAGGHLEIQ